MIDIINKQHRRAFELTQIWDRYFPSLKGRAPVEFWMVQLEDYTMNILAQAVKQTARRRLTHEMTLSEMLEHVSNTSAAIAGDRPATEVRQ